MRLAQIIGMMGKEGEIIVDLSKVKALKIFMRPFFFLFFFFLFRKSTTSATFNFIQE